MADYGDLFIYETITLLNPNPTPAGIEIIALDRNGYEIDRSIDHSLSSWESNTISLIDIFGPEILKDLLTVRVVSDTDIAGIQLVDYPEVDLVGLPALTTASKGWLFHISTEGGNLELWTRIGIINPGSETADIHIEAFDANSNSLGVIDRHNLLPGAMYFTGTENTNTDGGDIPLNTAYIKATADRPISGYEVIGVVNGNGLSATMVISEEDITTVGFEITGTNGGEILNVYSMVRMEDGSVKSTAGSLGDEAWQIQLETNTFIASDLQRRETPYTSNDIISAESVASCGTPPPALRKVRLGAKVIYLNPSNENKPICVKPGCTGDRECDQMRQITVMLADILYNSGYSVIIDYDQPNAGCRANKESPKPDVFVTLHSNADANEGGRCDNTNTSTTGPLIYWEEDQDKQLAESVRNKLVDILTRNGYTGITSRPINDWKLRTWGSPFRGNIKRGDTVRVADTGEGYRIREGACGTLTSYTLLKGDSGIVVDGPTVCTLDGKCYTWWKVDWQNSPKDGWSAEFDYDSGPLGVPVLKKDSTNSAWPNWYIAGMPACLVEVLYHDNGYDSEWLCSKQEILAQGIANGIKEFLGNDNNADIPPLQWPLDGSKTDGNVITGFEFGDDWINSCGGLPRKHTGVDLNSGDGFKAKVGDPVYAAESGKVRTIFNSGEKWGQCIVIDHVGFTTTYWHINPIETLVLDRQVNKGDKIATIAKISGGGPHLHFGVRTVSYTDISIRGALPQKNDNEHRLCNDPIFPEKFTDPMELTYESSEAISVTYFKINNDVSNTTSRKVTLNNTAIGSPTHYIASEFNNFNGAYWQTYSTAPTFILSEGNGIKTVYFKVKNSTDESAVVNDSITLNEPTITVTYFKINNDASSTTNRAVMLNNTAMGSPTHYMASESSSFSGASWQIYSTAPNFTLSSGNGTKTVYFKVKNSTGLESSVVSDSIILNEPPNQVQVTVTTSPIVQYITVDGASYTPPRTFSWTVGSQHTIGTPSPQYSGDGKTRYNFLSWSDGGSQTHQITVSLSITTYTATFSTQYLLDTSVNPPNSGSITLNPPGPWYNSGQSVQLTAIAKSVYVFKNWSGDLSGSSNPAYLSMNGPKSVTANFNSDCIYSIFPISQSFDASGGSGSVSVAASSNCSWTATSNASWITINSGSSGIGDGTVLYTVSPNTSSSQRTGTMTIANNTFTVTQDGAVTCTYSLNPQSRSHGSGAETGSFDVNTNSSICSWLAYSDVSWITITSGSSGTGNGTVYYSIAANTSSSPRTGTITVYGAYSYTFTVTQAGATTCTYSLNPQSRSHGSGAETGSFDINTNSNICSWQAYNDVSWITITSGSSGTGSGTVYYSVAANTSSSPRTGTITVYGANSYIFTITQSGASTTQVERITNGSFSSGSSWWSLSGDFWAGTNLSNYRTSPGYAAGGVDSTGLPKDGAIGNMYQTLTIPSNATKATLSFWYNITSNDSTTSSNDFLNVTIQNSTGNYLSTVVILSNLNESSLGDYRQINYDVTSYKGQTIRINFLATTNSSYNTNTVFRIDDVSLMSDGN